MKYFMMTMGFVFIIGFGSEALAYDDYRIVDNYDGSQSIIRDTPSICVGFNC